MGKQTDKHLKLSPDFAKFDYLKELSFSFNRIPMFPDEMRQMKSLSWVSLNCDVIQGLLASPLMFMNLKTLYFTSNSGNKIAIGDGSGFNSLNELYISTAEEVSLNVSTLQN